MKFIILLSITLLFAGCTRQDSEIKDQPAYSQNIKKTEQSKTDNKIEIKTEKIPESNKQSDKKTMEENKTSSAGEPGTGNTQTTSDTAVFGAGCFWCIEAIYQDLKGVQSVEPGYAGGTTENPTYKDVSSGNTGHAEVARIIYDPSKISYDELLEVFWTTHDPTTLNRQGNDVGTQYRSAIFYKDDTQKDAAELSKKNVATQIWSNPVVTEITSLKKFYEAEDYHHSYYKNNQNAPYCQFVINPKLEKFRKKFHDKLK
ncbi:hypothetical protein BH10BAC5_BH10BAC5_02760 [soil metagenome]